MAMGGMASFTGLGETPWWRESQGSVREINILGKPVFMGDS